MKPFLIAFAAAAATMTAIDSVWLRTMYSRFYQPNIGHLLAEQVKYGPAVVFYIVYLTGLMILVVMPAFKSGAGWGQVFLMSAVFGVVAYGTYDLTNHATLRDWPWIVTVVDMIWGGLLTGVVGSVAVWAARTWA
jgi:uncharacterized membrane protein